MKFKTYLLVGLLAAGLCLGAASGVTYFAVGTTISSGLGAISHIAGPADQPLKLQAGQPVAAGVGKGLTLAAGIANGAGNAGGPILFRSALAGTGETAASLAQITAAGAYTVADGLGAVAQVVGPTDQALLITTQNGKAVNLDPQGAGGIGLLAATSLGGAMTVADSLGVVAQVIGPTDQAFLLSTQNDKALNLDPNGTGGIGLLAATSLGGVMTIADSLGAVTQIVGPTDQVTTIGTQNNQNLVLTPNGSGVIVASQDVQFTDNALTAGGITVNFTGRSRASWSSYSWTNAQVVALGAVGTGELTVCTLPAKTIVRRAVIVINTAATQGAALTVSLGRDAADYNDYILAADAKGAANTVYGDATAEMGTNLWEGAGLTIRDDLASYTATTAVKLQFIIGAGTLADVTASTGTVIMESVVLP